MNKERHWCDFRNIFPFKVISLASTFIFYSFIYIPSRSLFLLFNSSPRFSPTHSVVLLFYLLFLSFPPLHYIKKKSRLLHEILQKEKDMKNTTNRDLENDWEGWARTFLAQNQTLGLKSLCIMTESQVLYHLAGSNSINKYFDIWTLRVENLKTFVSS